MSFANPEFMIMRQSIVGMEGEYAKMFDPPTTSPPTPELVAPTNPVPEVMLAAGYQDKVSTPRTVQRDLLHGMDEPTWDGAKRMMFMTFRDGDNPSTGNGNFPAATIRIPRGVVFHCDTSGHGPPPHTIHWHGIEPTPMNDGVGHCSMELGQYVYQFQPNFIGMYFCHCHRNTVQHFEFGLYGLLLIDPPDAYFASVTGADWRTQTLPATIALNAIPIGACSDGRYRIQANTKKLKQFAGFVDGDPALGVAGAGDVGVGDPHAFTVPYDVEAYWVCDDRDSVWSDLAPDARATYPRHGSTPGVDDNFRGNAGGGVGPNDFFAFNDFNADYWYITGVPVPAHKGETGAIPAGVVIPAALNSGKSGTQVSINAKVGDTILIRCLDAAYNCIAVTFPIDVYVISFDGRALGVPPFGLYNAPFKIPKNTPYHLSTARRIEVLAKATKPMNTFATVQFINTRGQVPGLPDDVVATAQIPFVVT